MSRDKPDPQSLFDRLSKLAKGKSTSKTIKYESESSSTKVWVDGEEVDPSSVDLDLLADLGQFGMITDELAEAMKNERAETVTSAAEELAEVRAKGPAKKVECPACARNVVNRTGSCMYCGAALLDETAEVIEAELVDDGRTTRHEVDEKFLGGDAADGSQEQESDTEDAYLRRLRRM